MTGRWHRATPETLPHPGRVSVPVACAGAKAVRAWAYADTIASRLVAVTHITRSAPAARAEV